MSLYPDLDEDIDPDLERGRARALVVASAGPLFMGYAAVVAVLALVISVATKVEISTVAVLSAALPGWLGLYQVPLDLGGHDFGALPLLPTLLVVLLVGRAAGNAADRMEIISARDTIPVVAAIATTHAIAGGVIAWTTTTADFFAGVLVPAAVSAVAAIIGLARRGYLESVLGRVDELVVHGLRAAFIGLASVLGIGALVFLIGLAMSFTTVKALFAPGIGDSVGMFLLSIVYIPNAVVGGTAFAAGPGVTIGGLTATPLNFSGGPLPGVPVLAALPESGAPWWPLVFVLPLAAGALVGWVLRNSSEDPIARLRAVGAAAVAVAASCVVLGLGSGGRLADGAFNPLSMHPWSLGMSMLLWIALPGAVVTWWTGAHLVHTPSRGLLDDAIEAEAETETGAEAEEETEAGAAVAGEPEVDQEPTEDEPEDEPGDEPSGEPQDQAGKADLPDEIDK
jgi:predicted small integral membrane protein